MIEEDSKYAGILFNTTCLVGPEGFANAVPSMMEAWGERTPIIFITGSSTLRREDSGGFKEITFELNGHGAYSRLKYESGVHRVQRVPETESQGRIHTSTATVAVLPEVDEIDIDIDWNEVRIDIFHSGGAGGQNVNKVATAVRMTHEPSGIVVVCQDERSQAKNRARAESVLRSRLYDLEQEKQQSEEAAARKLQVGGGARAEKIRTYNFPQDRITDNRISLTVHSIDKVMDGDIDGIIEAVSADITARILASS